MWHCRRPGLILETAAPPPFLVRAMFLTGSSSHLIIFYISMFGFFLETLPMIFLQTAPGWPWSLAWGLGGKGSHRRKDFLHWSQHKVISEKLSVIKPHFVWLGSDWGLTSHHASYWSSDTHWLSSWIMDHHGFSGWRNGKIPGYQTHRLRDRFTMHRN